MFCTVKVRVLIVSKSKKNPVFHNMSLLKEKETLGRDTIHSTFTTYIKPSEAPENSLYCAGIGLNKW